MTVRRWASGEDDQGFGPMETDVNAELEVLGYSPLTPPGPLRTAARRALMLAETYDRTQNAAALPGLDRQMAAVMAEARQAAGPAVVQNPEAEEVSDFEEERRKRRPPREGTA